MFNPAESFEPSTLLTSLDPATLGLRPPKRAKVEVSRHASNPFAEGLTIQTKSYRAATLDSTTLEPEQGERKALEHQEIHYVDKAEFTKIFRHALRSMFDLPYAGSRVLVVLLTQLRPGVEEVLLPWAKHGWDAPDESEPLVLPYSTFFRGRADLVKAGFLAPSARGASWFWLNPARLYCGDRVRLVREYRVGKRGDASGDAPQPRVVYPTPRARDFAHATISGHNSGHTLRVPRPVSD